MRYTFPATRFVEENSSIEQIEHVISEAQEMINECEIKTVDNGKGYDLRVISYRDGFLEEAMDLYHSLETLFRNWEIWGVDIETIKQKVEQKNRERGYYITTGEGK